MAPVCFHFEMKARPYFAAGCGTAIGLFSMSSFSGASCNLSSSDDLFFVASDLLPIGWQSTVFAALVQLLQPMALLVLMNTLPPLIRLLGMLEGFPAESRNQQAILSRYFYFQVGV